MQFRGTPAGRERCLRIFLPPYIFQPGRDPLVSMRTGSMKPYLVTTQRPSRFEARSSAPQIEQRIELSRPAPKRPIAHLRRPLRIGYVLDRFPRGSHSFVLQEILEL